MLVKPSRTLAALAMLIPVVAHAHPAEAGHTHAVLQGLLHPLTGLDHLVFMLALGIYAAHLPGRLGASMGAASVMAIILGAVPQSIGLTTEVVELGVLASLAVMGVTLISRRKVPAWMALPVAAVLSFLHGLAHAESGLDGVNRMEFIAGLVLTSGALFSVAALLFRRASTKNPALQDGSAAHGPADAQPQAPGLGGRIRVANR